MNDSSAQKFDYEIVPHIFTPSVEPTGPADYDYTSSDLGLIERDYEADAPAPTPLTQWQKLEQFVDGLNNGAPKSVQYKVLFLGRHGEGVHNVAERQYGRKSWDDYWARQEGNERGNWVDAHLTDKGIQQAEISHNFWAKAIKDGIPLPQSYYTSPLSRCLQTVYYTFGGLDLPSDRPFYPQVKELLRETVGRHYCDRRSSKSQLQAFASTFAPADTFSFEPGFSEEDRLWRADARETDKDTQNRVRRLLDDIFEHDRETWISLTSHSGAIRAILAVAGHREFRLAQGSVMAILVKGSTRD